MLATIFAVSNDFVESVRHDRTPIVTFSQMRIMHQMMESIYQSAKTEQDVQISQ